MNIKSNEILLLNKIKLMGEKSGEETSQETVASSATPEKGMNALMFKGMRNLMSSPSLAHELGVGKDIEIKHGDPSYVAPFSQNVAFKGGVINQSTAGKIIGVASAAILAVSCTDLERPTEVNQQVEVNVDFSELTNLISQLTGWMAQINAKLDKLDTTNYLLDKMNDKLVEILNQVSSGKISMEEGFNKIFNQLVVMKDGQDLILQQLIENGMKEDDANRYLQQLIYDVEQGNMTAQQAWNDISGKLGLVIDSLSTIYSALQDAFAKFEKRLENIQKGVDNIEENTDGIRADLNVIITQNEIMKADLLAAIQNGVLKLNDNVNVNIAKIAEILNMSTEELKATLIKLGISEAELINMSTQQLVQSIEDNTDELKQIKKTVNALYAEFLQGKIDAEEFAKELLKALAGISNQITGLTTFLKDAYAALDARLAAIALSTQNIEQNTKITNAMLDDIIVGQQKAVEKITNAIDNGVFSINSNVSYNMEKIANEIGMNLSDFKDLIVRLHISDQELLTMSVGDLLSAINDNTEEVINARKVIEKLLKEYQAGRLTAEQLASEILATLNGISGQIADLKAFLMDAYTAIDDKVNQIMNNTYNIDNNVSVISTKLDDIVPALERVSGNITTAINNGVLSVNDNASLNATKIANAIGMSVEDLKDLLERLNISNQELLTMSVADLLDAIKQNTEAVKAAHKTIEQLLAEFKAGKISAEQFASAVLSALDGISGQIAELSSILKAAFAAIDEKMSQISASTSNIAQNVTDINGKMDTILPALEKVSEKITKAISDGVLSLSDVLSANTTKIANAIGMSTSDLMSLMTDLNISNQELLTMSVRDLQKAINATKDEITAARQSLDALLAEYRAGRISAEQFAAQVLLALDGISGQISELASIVKSAFDEIDDKLAAIKASTYNIDRNVTTITSKMDAIIPALEKLSSDITKAIKDGTVSINANVATYADKIADAIGMSKSELMDLLNRLNISNQELQTMSVQQLLSAINDNTKEVKNNRQTLLDLLDAFKAGRISAQQFAAQVIAALDGISGQLSDIYNLLKTAYDEYQADRKEVITLLQSIEAYGAKTYNSVAALNSLVSSLSNDVKDMLAQGEAFKTQLNAMKDAILKAINESTISQNSTIKAQGDAIAAAIGMTKDQLIEALTNLGYSINDVQNMNAQAIIDAINNGVSKLDNELAGLRNEFNTYVQLFKSGAMTAQQFGEKVLELLGQIKSGIDGINDKLNDLYDLIKAGFEKTNNSIISVGDKIINGQNITNTELAKLNIGIEQLKQNQLSYKQDFADLKTLITNGNATQAEILEAIKNNTKALDLLGLSVTQAMSMSTSQLLAAIKSTENKLDAQTAVTIEIRDLLNIIKDKDFGGADVTALLNAINALKTSVDNGNTYVNANLDKVLKALQDIYDKLGDIEADIQTMIEELKGVSSQIRSLASQLKTFDNYWQQALGSIKDYSGQLEEIKALLAAGNATTSQMNQTLSDAKAILDDLRTAIARAEAYQKTIANNTTAILEKLEQFKDIDYDRLEAAMKGVSDYDYDRYSALLKSLMIDPKDFESVADLILAINEKAGNIKNNTDYIKLIYDILKDVDWTKPDNAALIQQIIEKLNNITVNCQCSCCDNHGGTNDEGGHGLDDLIND